MGAAILRPCEDGQGFQSFYCKSDGRGADTIGVIAGGSVMPLTPENVAEGKHFLYMDGPEVWKWALRVMPESLREAISRAGLTIGDIDFVVTHQANQRMIEAILKVLEVPVEKTYMCVNKYGNTSSGSIGTALDEAVRAGKIKPGMNVAMAGIGAGFTWAGTVLKWTGPV